MCHYVYEQNAVNTAKIRLFTGGSYRPINKLLARRVSFSGRRSSIKALTEVIIAITVPVKAVFCGVNAGEPTHHRVIIPSTQVNETSLCVVILTAVAERVAIT